jgi:hypothetical protein
MSELPLSVDQSMRSRSSNPLRNAANPRYARRDARRAKVPAPPEITLAGRTAQSSRLVGLAVSRPGALRSIRQRLHRIKDAVLAGGADVVAGSG